MLGQIGIAELLLIIPLGFIGFIIPAIVLYFVIKLAVKNAVKELKKENKL